MVSGGNSHKSSSTKHSSHEKNEKPKDKSKYMYMERRKGNPKASIVYDPNRRSGQKKSSKSQQPNSYHGPGGGDIASMTQTPMHPVPMSQGPVSQGPTSQEHTSQAPAMAHYGPSEMASPKPKDSRGQLFYEDVRVRVKTGRLSGGHQPGYPTGSVAGPYSSGLYPSGPYAHKQHAPETDSQFFGEEEDFPEGMQYGSTHAPSVASGPGMRGGVLPSDSVSQCDKQSRHSAHSGYSGNPGDLRTLQKRDATKSNGGVKFSWVEAKPGGKQYLHRGAKPHRPSY
ncbi:uncharacterized protein GGS22DRAFT_199315 [Annulohypoxylon maeteangense]|uniref:uncharacterized protein n=1 Tax=Annulohypoxylon maeteangense TaxID=1927788 RepID=UPI002007623B|nr:uncharacterized protein GGS22DRAFT_199315 [Annulohypoxylon maeteangense]KAI0886986.1 hypothetical protein GGS22DRAFT_199315 [Annulohypoxylon maeteangense]